MHSFYTRPAGTEEACILVFELNPSTVISRLKQQMLNILVSCYIASANAWYRALVQAVGVWSALESQNEPFPQ